MASAGRILIMPKGGWAAETEYEMLDLVAHNGRAWVAKKASVGIEPSEENAEYWHDFLGMDVFTEANPPTAEQVGAIPSEVAWFDNVDVFATLGTNTFETRLYKFSTPSANAPSDWTYFSVLKSGNSAFAFGANDKKGAVAISRFSGGAWSAWELNYNTPSNNNILINSNFANPVNQRGYVSGTDFMNKYTLDRWRGTGNLLIVENSYITLAPLTGTTANTFIQLLEKPEQYSGKVTLSLKCRTSTPEEQIQLFADGVANGGYSSLGYHAKHLSKANEWEVITQTFNLNETFSELKFGTNTGGTFDVEWMKLEIGDHATPYVPRLYAEELELCKRYYEEFDGALSLKYMTSDRICCYNRISEKRIKPTLSLKNGVYNTEDSIRVINSSANLITDFSFTPAPSSDGKGKCEVNVTAIKENHGLTGLVSIMVTGNRICVDAEL